MRATLGGPVEETEAEVLRFAASLLLAGESMTQVTDALSGLGHRPRRAKHWSYQLLRHRLSREQISGAILDVETFAQLQLVLEAGTARYAPVRNIDKPYPLSGRLFGTCGAQYTGLYRRERDQRWYVCANKRWVNRETRCDDKRLRADEVERSVWWSLLNFVSDEEALVAYAEREWFERAEKRVAAREERDRQRFAFKSWRSGSRRRSARYSTRASTPRSSRR